MKIAVDLDGVVYEFQRTYAYMMREYRGIEFQADQWTEWNSPKDYCAKEDRDWLWSEGVKLGLFRYGHMVKGARRGLQQLVADGHTIEIVTHRPAQAVSDTIDWVALMFKDIPLDGMMLLTRRQPKTISNARLLIDDKNENLLEWEATGRPALRFVRPWNNADTRGSATGWEFIPHTVELLQA